MNDAGRIGFLIKGEYESTSIYDFLDIVYYNGASYVAKKNTVGNTPAENNEYWQIFAKNSSNIGELTESVAGIESWKDSTQQRLDNWGPTIVGHGQVINSNRDRITELDGRIGVAEQNIEDIKPVSINTNVGDTRFTISSLGFYVFYGMRTPYYEDIEIPSNLTTQYIKKPPTIIQDGKNVWANNYNIKLPNRGWANTIPLTGLSSHYADSTTGFAITILGSAAMDLMLQIDIIANNGSLEIYRHSTMAMWAQQSETPIIITLPKDLLLFMNALRMSITGARVCL